MKRSKGLTVALVTLPLLVLSGPAATATTSCSNWTLDQLQPAGSLSENLAGIAAISSSDVWVVGTEQTSAIYPYQYAALTEHWDGAGWTVVPTPDVPGATSTFLTAVTALSPSDIWAVGTVEYQPGDQPGETPLALHWDGLAWNVVPMPSPGGSAGGGIPLSVSFASPDDGWAVGWLAPTGVEVAFTEHWDGTSWSIVPNPAPASDRQSILYAVTDSSPTDAWAVGYTCGSIYGCGGITLFLHWDGTSWNKVSGARSHGRQVRGGLYGVTAVGPTDVWAVGDALQGLKPHKTRVALTEHWDGTAWTRFDAPVGGQLGSRFLSVTSAASGQVWAAGWKAPYQDPLLQRWDGSRWRNVGKAEPTGQPWLTGISAVPSGDSVWAMGSRLLGYSLPTTYYVEHCQ